WLDELRQRADQVRPGDNPLLATLSLIAGLAIAVLAAWLLARSVLRRAEGRSADDVEEVRDFVWSWDSLRRGLLRWLGLLGRRPPLPAGAEVTPPQATDAAGSPARGVREIYRALLRLGARL